MSEEPTREEEEELTVGKRCPSRAGRLLRASAAHEGIETIPVKLWIEEKTARSATKGEQRMKEETRLTSSSTK